MKYRFIVFLVGFTFLITGCRKYSDFLYEVVELSVSNADNSDEEPLPLSIDSLASDSYAIRLDYTMIFKGANGSNDVEGESGYANEYTVSSFNVHTLEDFDSSHPQGTSLNEFFLVSYGGEYYSANTINSIIGTGSIGGGNFSATHANGDTWTREQYLVLMQPPENNGSYTFIIDISQSNNTFLSDTTSIILY